jgi:hypothetical protein
MQKIYITKYALTKGIVEAEAEIKESPYFQKCAYAKDYYIGGFFNDDFHFTKEEAVAHAEKQRLKKIESLKKQISKLENIS